MKKYLFLLFMACFAFETKAQTTVDIYGPGRNVVSLSTAIPLNAPNEQSGIVGTELYTKINENLSFLPFIRFVSNQDVLGGAVLDAWKGAALDFRRFQIAGADLLITAYWPDGDGNGEDVEIRVFETFAGKFIFGNSYSDVSIDDIGSVADRFCADFMKALTGSGDFFLSTLVFAKDSSHDKRDIWISSPTGKRMRQITSLPGIAMSPAWSPDGRYIVFNHIDASSHALGVWESKTGRVKRIRFPGNTVISPNFLPNNKVAVSLSTGNDPDIFLLSHRFVRERVLEGGLSIEVSPNFDNSGTKMAFTSNRLGGPQVFLKDFKDNSVKRISKSGGYNTEPTISPDGTLVAYTKLTENGHRIFVHDLITGLDKQISFGPGRDEHPAFAPDSYFIAYISDRTKEKKIYLTTRHGGDPKQVPTGAGSVSFPRWGKLPWTQSKDF